MQLLCHACTVLWYVKLSSVLGGPSICPFASVCRTLPHPLRWQHNSNLVFWIHVWTSKQQCSIIQIMFWCKDCNSNTWWWFRLYLLLLYPCTQGIHISDLGLTDWIDVKRTLRQICCPKLYLDFVWSLMNFIQVDRPHRKIVHIFVLGEIRQNLLDYIYVLIPDSRGSQHLPIWAALACRTLPHPLRWQHSSSLVF